MFAGTGLSLLFAALLSGQTPAQTPIESVVLERFKIAKGGDVILVPVKLAGRERMFMLDTGATRTVVDRNLLNGEPVLVGRGVTADREIDATLFRAPDATVGSLGFKGVDNVGGMDLAPLREVSGFPIEGILGMDFLFQHVVRADFDKGELCFLNSADSRCGMAVPLFDDDELVGLRDVRGSVCGLEKIPFLVDTGHGGPSSGNLDAETFGLLKKWKDLRIVSKGNFRSLSGDSVVEDGQSGALTVGGLRVDQPVWASGNRSILGLGFLSRYVVTFDFPKKTMYLRPGTNVAKPDLWNGSGLHVLRKNGVPVVELIDGGSPGEKAGVKPGDVLLRVGEVRAGTDGLFEIRRALCGHGQIPVAVRRGGEERTFTLQVGP